MPKPTKIAWTNADGGRTVRWQVRYRDRDGRRRARQFDRKAEASDFADTIKAEVRGGGHVAARATVTIAVAAATWLAACRAGRDGRDPVEPTTLRQYEQHARLHIVPVLGGLRIADLTAQRVRAFRDDDCLGGGSRGDGGDDRPPLSRAMTKKVLGSLSAICNEARARGQLVVNPCDGITITRSSRTRTAIVIPTKDEVRLLLACAAGWIDGAGADAGGGGRSPLSRYRALWFHTLLLFLVSTGTRLSEARGAAWADLDLEHGTYRVGGRADDRGTIGPPKSLSGRRSLELSATLVAALERWRRVAPRSPHVFSNAGGGVERMQTIYRSFWHPLLVACGMARRVASAAGGTAIEAAISMHDIRHFHAALQIEAGMQAKELQAHMGHASIAMTMDVYGHLFHDDGAAARRRAIVVGAVEGLLADEGGQRDEASGRA